MNKDEIEISSNLKDYLGKRLLENIGRVVHFFPERRYRQKTKPSPINQKNIKIKQ